MNRYNAENESDLIDLGAVTAETKGPPLPHSHDTVGSIPVTGLTDD